MMNDIYAATHDPVTERDLEAFAAEKGDEPLHAAKPRMTAPLPNGDSMRASSVNVDIDLPRICATALATQNACDPAKVNEVWSPLRSRYLDLMSKCDKADLLCRRES